MVELPKIDTSNLWDKTYALLKESIIRREFAPNQKLSIPDLSIQLGVSRTPVRDALNRLEMEGLVKTISKVGTFVVAIDREDVLNIMDTRLMLELWVADQLVDLPSNELAAGISRMETILDFAEQDIAANKDDEYLKADYNLQFHIAFMQLGGNKNNIDIYLRTMNYRYITLKSSIVSREMVQVAQNQHRHIIQVIKQKDTNAVKKALREHLEDSKRRLLEVINEHKGII
ncbi:GntR family transcriptional regulator [Paenibacillus yanchengensis]|uniref:GntR family transcriptional regulator n=1 Tax=Paenibacillus yanchengensis TaxID=2035833 RepID=A0ABW4YP59_9BACL